MFDFAETTKDMTAAEILNYYRNLYYAEPQVTERGIVANAINDYFNQTAPKTEWISVDERLPEPNEECLVSARVGDRVVIDLGELIQYCDGRIFGWMTTNDWDEGEGCKITHWMPLPEPPKGE